VSGPAGALSALTHEEVAALELVRAGADVWGYGEAMALRSVQKKAPGLITICKAMEQPAGHLRRPYFGAIATSKGRAALLRAGGAL